jgi:hypothetical protein
MRRRLAVLPATVSALLLLTSPVAALGALDQQQTSFNNFHGVAGSQFWTAQQFTAGLTGQLDHVDLNLSTGPSEPDPIADLTTNLTVEIWTVVSGAPDAPVPGASATVPLADVPQGEVGPVWVQVAISAPSVAGTEYAIVLSAPAADPAGCPVECWQWAFEEAVSAPYAGGAAQVSNDGGANWSAVVANDPDSDFAFRTYVTAPAASLADAATVPPSPTSPLVTLGFGLLLAGGLGMLLVANVRRQTR